MLILLSPAKTMKYIDKFPYPMRTPHFPEETKVLMDHLKHFQADELEKIMKVNATIASQNYERYQNFLYDTEGSPALFTYTGLQYKNIMADTFTEEDMGFANQCIRIISGLYGVLVPFSSIYPYRLDFEMKLNLPGSQNLYAFWENKIYEFLRKEDEVFINLASQEYSKAVLPYVQEDRTVITCSFYVEKNGKRKMESTAAKMARGLMTGYIVKERLTRPEELKAFQENGFQYEGEVSTDSEYVFVRRA